MSLARRIRALLDAERTDVPKVLTRAQGMHDGMAGDVATYALPNPPLPAFQTQIQNLASAQQLVKTRVVGAAAMRDDDRDVLYLGMETQCMYVQTLVEASPGKAIALIQNAGLAVAGFTPRIKPLLALKLGKPSGTVLAYANVGLLVAAAKSLKPNGYRFFNWESTIDGKTFVTLPSTPTGKTVLSNLTLLTTIGVRVSLTNGDGVGEWSQVVNILVQ